MATSSSETAFLTVEKSMTYRGAREHWSNVYHFDNIPPDTSAWQTLGATVAGLEIAFLPVDTQIEIIYGHNPGTPPLLVYESDQPPAGEGGLAGQWVPGGAEYPTSGDVAGWIRYGTTQKTSRGKPIYLRNYYHSMYSWGDKDSIASNQVTPMNALAAAMVTGLNVNGVTYRRAGPRGAVAQNHLVGPHLTTRTLKHRGRRHRFSVPAGSTVQVPPIVVTGPIGIN